MAEKLQAVGVCDHCLGPIPPKEWYTRRGPRLYCSLECRQTANSRAGNPIRVEKIRERMKRGEWRNPSHIRPPTPAEQSHRARLGRKREVAAGTWRNPARDDAARAKLSRPRRHEGALHSAIEKLGRGLSMADLTDEEAAAYRARAAELRAARREEINRRARERYAARQAAMTDEEREAQRARWREGNRRRAPKR
jgi:hypothetical protein